MKILPFIKHAYERFKAPTPAFWKSVQRKFARLAALLVVLGGIYEATPDGYLPEWIIDYITYGGVICGVIVAVAQFACEDQPNDSRK